MQQQTSTLSDLALDWAVATCLGLEIVFDGIGYWVTPNGTPAYAKPLGAQDRSRNSGYSPSTNGFYGMEIIHSKLIATRPSTEHENWWIAETSLEGVVYTAEGPTPLIAAMRCLVTSEKGDTIDVPEAFV